MSRGVVEEVRDMVEAITPVDPVESHHRADVLSWLAATDDIFRRVAPATPPRHLVSYFLLVDPGRPADPEDGRDPSPAQGARLLLVDHIKAGRWLPTGGHVEPGESPVTTVRREAREELGIEARFASLVGERPLLVTVSETVGTPADRHTDVSLWFVLQGRRDDQFMADASEFHDVRWWSIEEVATADPTAFDPHLGRMLTKLQQTLPSRPGTV